MPKLSMMLSDTKSILNGFKPESKIPINPTHNANYLITPQIIFCQYPSSPEEKYLYDNPIDKLLETQRDVFVNATTIDERKSQFDYISYVKERKTDVIFIDYPIEDGTIPTDVI